jgi:hypothetical protein
VAASGEVSGGCRGKGLSSLLELSTLSVLSDLFTLSTSSALSTFLTLTILLPSLAFPDFLDLWSVGSGMRAGNLIGVILKVDGYTFSLVGACYAYAWDVYIPISASDGHWKIEVHYHVVSRFW